jgi:hypothetical protein
MTLQEVDGRWSAYLADERCPTVLGLAPLSEEESREIHGLVGHYSHAQPSQLFQLLETFPSCVAVWLARKAGEAYESGAFWEKFAELIGVPVPMHRRDEFAKRFRRACRNTMTAWLPPEDLGGHNIVAEFLYQAGLPLDRCERFAQHVRKVERSFGLPDADAPDAGEQLREAMLDSLQAIPEPTLKRALRGPAGPRICEVALSVVVNGDYTGINPRLGQELERVFEHAERSSLRRSMHQPFLRLGDDLGSLEIVGPRQDDSIVAGGGLAWVVNGRRIPTPRSEEFVEKVTDQPRVAIELAGLVGGAASQRTFALRLDDRTEPFILFDERNSKERRANGPIPVGSYWLLHRSIDSLRGGEQRYDWPDGERALSFFRIRPGCAVALDGSSGGQWQFVAVVSPFFEAVGDCLPHEAKESICFGWPQLPAVWMSAEHADPELLSQWRVDVCGAGNDHTWKLSRTVDEAGGMVKCRIEGGSFLPALPPAMYRLRFSLRRAERSRTEAYAEYWLWHGLNTYGGRGFTLHTAPQNVIRSECRGFEFQTGGILHRKDQQRCHTLSFDICGSSVAFDWSQPGVFLESLERRVGERTQVRSHRLGDAFSASLDSARWLRLWLTGESDWEVLVNGQSWQRAVHGDRRDFVELSLASLAVALSQGGEIRLRLGSQALLVARFSSPLQPLSAEYVHDGLRRGFRFQFQEPISWARPIAWDLSSGQKRSFPGQQFDSTGQCAFLSDELPQIECINELDPNETGSPVGHFVTLWVPKIGWPGGLWLIDLEVRRDEAAEWESVLVNGREYAPVVIRAAGAIALTRPCLFWASLSPATHNSDLAIDQAGCQDLLELLVDLIVLRKREFVLVARQDMGWLKDAVRFLSQLAGRMARQPKSDGFQAALLNLACEDPNHTGFVYMPRLLALPAGDYCELPAGDPLNDSLRRCGRLALTDSIAEMVRTDFGYFDISVLSRFGNFATIVSGLNSDAETEFAHFDHEGYWQDVVGTIQISRLAADWSGSGVLGKPHTIWALAELVRRYEHSVHELNLAAANALLHSAQSFRGWLSSRLGQDVPLSTTGWKAPWLRFVAPDTDFLEAVPRFASLFALAARASAAGLLEFEETLKWLEGQVGRRYMAEEGIAVLVGLAPELFGHQLLFWELTVRTARIEV